MSTILMFFTLGMGYVALFQGEIDQGITLFSASMVINAVITESRRKKN